MKAPKPLAQDYPAFMGTAQALFLAFIASPVIQKVLFLPKAEVTDGATVDLLLPMSLLVLGEPEG